jgi:hypothetical protein
VAASTAEGGSADTEVMIAVDRDGVEPSRLVIGVDRRESEAALRATIDAQFQHRVAGS